MFSISIARIHIQIASISRHTYFGQVCVDVTCFWYLSVSSLNTSSLKRKAYWLTDLHVTVDWIWRYMIRLGISINILWTSMRILPCYWYTSFASSILWKFHISKARSSITLHDVYSPDIDQWLYFKSHVTSHIWFLQIDISVEMIIFIVVHSSFTNRRILWSRSLTVLHRHEA